MTAPLAARLLLVDDHTLFREGLRRLLEGETGLTVCADFATAQAALKALRSGIAFDVALIDYELTVVDGAATSGLDLLREIRALHPEARVLMVTAGMPAQDLIVSVRDLNAGIFLKTEPIAELLLAIQRTVRGERWISSGAALALLSTHQAPMAAEVERQQAMTPRETLVMQGVLEGLSNKEIGAQLEITESAVKSVLQRLFEKKGVRSRSQLVRCAIEAQNARD